MSASAQISPRSLPTGCVAAPDFGEEGFAALGLQQRGNRAEDLADLVRDAFRASA